MPLRAGVYVGAAIFRQEELLLLRRVDGDRGRWELPGGSVEVGENLDEALRREVMEENGIRVQVGRPPWASTFEADGRDGQRASVVAVEYLCRPVRSGAALPQEHGACARVRAEALESYRLTPVVAPIVRSAYRERRRRPDDFPRRPSARLRRAHGTGVRARAPPPWRRR